MMSTDDRYEQWKQGRANVEAPADFADRVMKTVEQAGQERAAAGWLLLLLSSRPARISVGVLAVAVCALRVAAVAAVFLFPR
jgi:hypothetical protein